MKILDVYIHFHKSKYYFSFFITNNSVVFIETIIYSSIFVKFDTSPVFLTLQSLLYPVKDNQVSGYFTDFVKKKKKWPRDNDRIIKLFKYLSFIRRRKKKDEWEHRLKCDDGGIPWNLARK